MAAKQEVCSEIENSPAQPVADASKQRLCDELLSQPSAIPRTGSDQGSQLANSNNVQAGDNLAALSSGPPQFTGFLQEPGNGVQDIETAINNAQHSVQMENFHLTDPGVVQALEDAHARGRNVQVILDAGNLAKDNAAAANAGIKSQEQILADNGVSVVPSSQDFRITHSKTMLIDGNTDNSTAYITSMNLTTHEGAFRDFGVSTKDPMITNDLGNLFQADLKNAQIYQQDKQAGIDPLNDPNAEYTPPTISPFLFVSPLGGKPNYTASAGKPNEQALSENQSEITQALSSLSPADQSRAQNDFAKAIDEAKTSNSDTNDQYNSSDQLKAEQDLASLPNGDQLVQLFAARMQDDNINRVVGIFDRAQTKVVGETENIGDPGVLNSIKLAAERGVEVDLIIPDPDGSDSQTYSAASLNKSSVEKLEQDNAEVKGKGFPGINIEYMPFNASDPTAYPYMHAKWLVADGGKEGYLGSENYSSSSLDLSRETGIIMENQTEQQQPMQQMVQNFNQDWSKAQPVPASDQLVTASDQY